MSPVWNQPPRQAFSVAVGVVQVAAEASRRGVAAEWRTSISPGVPSGTSWSASSATRTSKPGTARPMARVPTLAGASSSKIARTNSVMPQISISGIAEAGFELGMPLRVDAGAEAEADVVVALARMRGWLSSIGTTTPR